jgi:hypothetical protein
MAGRTPKLMRTRGPIAMLGCAAVAAALSACGSSSATDDTTSSGSAAGPATATRTVTHTQTPTAGSSSTTAAATTSTSTSSSTANAAPAGQCVASDLALSFLGGQGATGHGELGFALKNTGSDPCPTGGYPGVLFLDRNGHGLPTRPTHTTDDFFGHTTLGTLHLAPGATASFRLGVTHVGTGGSDKGCATAAGLQVIAPNDTATMRVTVAGGIAECGGTVTVSPLQPGHSALG